MIDKGKNPLSVSIASSGNALDKISAVSVFAIINKQTSFVHKQKKFA